MIRPLRPRTGGVEGGAIRSVEESRPKPGLSVPVLTVLDEDGRLIEEDQRALVRHVVQDGAGADIVFSAGTTGEWDKIDNPTRQAVIRVCAEEVAKLNPGLVATTGVRVESWAGVTAPTARDTLANLEFAIDCGVDAAVLAPLSIQGVDDPVRFVLRDVADLLDARPRRIPVFLYDNADIAIDPKVPHIRTKQVKAMSRLDFVRGIKVSASNKVLGNYTRAAKSFKDRGEFGIYIGNAKLIFDLYRPYRGWLGVLQEHWDRWRRAGGMPLGVVAGPANALPREWAWAWQVCRAGDEERMDAAQRVVDALRDCTVAPSGKRTLASLKRALHSMGVISSDRVAPGTPALTSEEAERVDRSFEEVRHLASELIGPNGLSRFESRFQQDFPQEMR
jgi:dihydrodipicolinate synthase/N-acetylneuraminate lyase